MEPSLDEILEFALMLSHAAGEFILPLWNNTPVEFKADGTVVTKADRGAEELLRGLISKRYPGHIILGEEHGGEWTRNADHLWILDPVDGTSAFSIGLPVFGTLIGYLRRGEPVVGIIGAHALGETVYAAKDCGCWVRSDGDQPRRTYSSAVTDLAQSVAIGTIAHTDMDPCNPDPSFRASWLYRDVRQFRGAADCISYALLCKGRVEIAFDSRMKPWDIAALVPCIREAGGIATALDGNEDVVWQPNLIASANAELHAAILKRIWAA
jgi:histidinol-phosphatase